MAGNNLRVNANELAAAISNFEVRKQEFQDVLNGIKAVVYDLEATWVGETEKVYESQMRELLSNMSTIIQSLDGAKQKMQLALTSYGKVEETIKKSIEGLEEGKGNYGNYVI